MGLQTTQISSFAMGEIDPALNYRFNEAEYLKACKKLQNFIVTAYGSALKRNGTAQYLNVTTEIGTSTKIKFFTELLSSPSSGMVFVGALLVDQVLNLQVLGPAGPIGAMQPIDLAMTVEQAHEARFLSAQNSIVILHPEIATQRITFDGTTFSKALFVYINPPTYDFRTVNYYSNRVFIEAPSGGSNTTLIHVENTNFTTAWEGGYIIGPGPDDVSPFGAGRINTVTVTSTETIFEVLASSPFLTSSSYATSSALGSSLAIQQVVFTDELGYPGDGVYYQNRLFLTGHPKLPVTIFGTKLGSADDFTLGVGLPTDAISYTMEQENTGKILFLNVGTGMQVFTELAEYSVPTGIDPGLTPASFTLKWQSNKGISKIALPTNFQSYSFYAGANGKAIYKMEEAGGVEQQMNSELISQFASHLINSPLKLATFYSYDRTTILLAVLNSDNTMAFLSYNPQMNVIAWSSFVLDSDISIIDMDSANNVLYLVVKYNVTDIYFIEKLDFNNVVPVDSASAVTIPVSSEPPTLTGLEIYNGYEISVSDGVSYLGSYFVENGQITLDDALEHPFSGFVGLNFTPILTPMFAISDPGYAYSYKILDDCYVNYQDSLGVLVNNNLIQFQNVKEIKSGQLLTLKSGTAEIFTNTGWGRFKDITISQEAPVGMHILSIAYRMSEGGL
jgi:hypothetical protein